MKFLLSIFCFLLCCVTAKAATNTAASPQWSDVNSAVRSAARGDTVIVPSGAATWANTLVITNGLTLIGAGRSNITITCSGVAVELSPDATALSNGEQFRVTDFTFDGAGSALNLIHVVGATGGASKAFTNMAIGNCTFQNTSTTTSGSGAVWSTRQVRGCIYSNIFDRCNVILKIMGNNDDGTEWANGHWPRTYGTADNLYFEGNTIRYSTSYSGQDSGWNETGQGARLVMRYNTWNMANASYSELWDVHGFQNWPGNGQTGTMITEYYGNTVQNMAAGRWITHRGGWALFFNNIVTGTGGAGIEINQYAPGDTGGSGCNADIPGALGVYDGQVTNTYVFNNTVNGSIKNMAPGPIGDGCGTAQNSNWYNYNASFSGATGIGRGTTAPAGSCTAGVAYWKCSTPTPTTDPTIVQSGHLYKATATDTWTDYYTPYTFPHPLSGASQSTPNTNPPTITSGNASGTASNSFSYAIAYDGAVGTNFGASNLPSGLTIAAHTGVISGIPTSAQTNIVTLSVTNDYGFAHTNKTFTIAPYVAPPTFPFLGNTNTTSATDTIGVNFINATKFYASNNLVLLNVHARVVGVSGHYKCAIYSDYTNAPFVLMGTTTELGGVSSGWTNFPFSSPVTVANGSPYWLAIWSDDSGSAIYTSGAQYTLHYGTRTYGDWPTANPNLPNFGFIDYSIYADGYEVTNSPSTSIWRVGRLLIVQP